MGKVIKILGIAGSLRQQSYNHGLLQAAQEVAPADCKLEILDLKEIPLYNQDEEANLPSSVVHLKTAVREADALLIATPEFNYSIPGVLKNALDWGSRPYGDNAWDGKPVAILGASVSPQGTSRAQYHLRQVFVYLNMHPLNKPEVMVGTAQEKFNEKGHLVDAKVRQRIADLLAALIPHARKFSDR